MVKKEDFCQRLILDDICNLSKWSQTGAIIDAHLEDFAERGVLTIRKGEQTQFFQVIRSEGNELQYKAFTSIGELYDSATIIKDFKSEKNSTGYTKLQGENI